MEADNHRAESFTDLADLDEPAIWDLNISDKDVDLVITLNPLSTTIRALGNPSDQVYSAAHRLTDLLKPRQVWWLSRRDGLIIYGTLTIVGALGFFLATWVVPDVKAANQVWITLVILIFVGVPVSIFTVERAPRPPPIIMRRKEWDSRGFLKRHGLEAGLILAALGIIVSIAIAVLDK